MQYIVGVILGGILTLIAMILNSYFNARIAREKEQREYKRISRDKYISELEGIYIEVLHSLEKVIRDKGMGTESQIEKLNRLDIELGLKSKTKIHDEAQKLMFEISNMAKSLSPLPDEFIPKFEDDDNRRYRLEKRRKAEQKRSEEAKKFSSKVFQMYRELAIDMKAHLDELKKTTNT